MGENTMSLFGPPKCPYCGGPLKETYYSLPPYWRCPRCIERNKEKKETEKKIAELNKRIEGLEKREADR
jgi:tRNA(Ile2) C34 agmatinyltransferase TiaS